MRLEDMKHEFPQMPDEIRAMVEKEVAWLCRYSSVK